ncbi:MAG: DUF1338 domain-containing protein [Bacteroidetes bacterium HGW-Bacteroidetes-15]|nr:MAG: DUF1338 domain-containing protein [Bacteroidetes bacterium HGW-Bacteroidetes-15]
MATDLNKTLKSLWDGYANQNPSAKRIHSLFAQQGENIVNDHIAFRTFNDPSINIEVLSKLFKEHGYEERGDYHFEAKHLYAKHYEHPNHLDAPRIFISQLIVEDFSPFLQEIVRGCISRIPSKDLNPITLPFAGNIWGKPNWDTYIKLRDESEYAAWLYVHGFRVNHFTVSVNHLKKYGTMESTNQFLKDNGFTLNSSGGEIKGTPEELLQQSSTMGDIVSVEFDDRVENVPACYYEFARRFPDEKGKLYSGFIAKSADKIFESTNFYRK